MILFATLGFSLIQIAYLKTPGFFSGLHYPSNDDDIFYPSTNCSSDFDWKVLKSYAPLQNNLLLSPIYLKNTLFLIYQGSTGEAKSGFENVLQVLDEKSANEEAQDVIQKLQISDPPKYHVNQRTAVFLDTSVRTQAGFITIAEGFYKTDIISTNFSNLAESEYTINSWAEKLTNGKITQFIIPADLEDAIAVIGNAVYFKGTWKHQFSLNNTKVMLFNSRINNNYFELAVVCLSTINKFYFYDSKEFDAKILRLPYEGDRYSMFIVLPNAKDELPSLIKQMNTKKFKNILYLTNKVPVDVKIPKFKLDLRTKISKTVQDANELWSIFPEIVNKNRTLPKKLVVSTIIQRCEIEVTESGSGVYYRRPVLTANEQFEGSISTFHATHPFLFYIEDELNGIVLFIGKLENPLTDTRH